MRAATSCVFAMIAACGGSGTPVSRTGSDLERPEHAPQARTDGVERVASGAGIPGSADPNERLVFLRAGSVWAMNPDGSEPNEIATRAAGAPDTDPKLAPRGGWIAFASARDGASKIYVTRLDEGVGRAITDGAGGGDRAPAWSPDGRKLAFVRGDPAQGPRAIYVLQLDDARAPAGAPRLIVQGDDDHPDRMGQPAWSPDGATIAFAADYRRGQGTRLWLVGAGGGEVRALTPTRPGAWFLRDRAPVWAPDGSAIAFASNRHVASGDDATDFDIYVIRPDGSGLTRLTEDPGVADHPAFSPDGKRLFFSSTRDSRNAYEVEIYVMPAAGGKQRRLTRDERPQNTAPSAGVM